MDSRDLWRHVDKRIKSGSENRLLSLFPMLLLCEMDESTVSVFLLGCRRAFYDCVVAFQAPPQNIGCLAEMYLTLVLLKSHNTDESQQKMHTFYRKNY